MISVIIPTLNSEAGLAPALTLLIPRRLYSSLGGYKAMPLMEDLDLIRRIGRNRMVILRSRAVISANRYRQEGYGLRLARNLSCLALYSLRVSPRRIAELYRQR